MQIANFDDLLVAARHQPLPQRLLFVFANIELPEGSTPEQCAAFEAGHGGSLVPLMCVDKSLQELDSFVALAKEAEQISPTWGVVFAAAMSGSIGSPPTSVDAELPLQRMVDAIKQGDIGGYIPFDCTGLPINLSQ